MIDPEPRFVVHVRSPVVFFGGAARVFFYTEAWARAFIASALCAGIEWEILTRDGCGPTGGKLWRVIDASPGWKTAPFPALPEEVEA